MTTLQLLGHIFTAVAGLGLFAGLLLGEPLKTTSHRRSLIFGASILVVSASLLLHRLLEPPPGVWWWLGVGGAVLAVLSSLGWLYIAATHWPKEGTAPQKMHLRPAALLLLLAGDALLLAAFRVHAPWAQVALVLLGCVVLVAFTKVIWVKPQAT